MRFISASMRLLRLILIIQCCTENYFTKLFTTFTEMYKQSMKANESFFFPRYVLSFVYAIE
ncbi:hypothetical protein SS35_01470 [Enterobacter hormaechei subsp. steigerwaltii]|nr:hypothetical protein SS35_01470 [Enterobacter hormaechei subsp. steigerwaltii]KJX42505.1 hypothetical protein SG78_04225 [Enterobacter hormaechei subsp. steigerwaltii]KKA34566.1 hypothetical protein SG77_07930 [Enterobacter hormaechei subsp. steigerwaltii]KTH40049.1 hypothetical protein ASV27_02310 [Enterobacter hormaechei subsp. steigerwaltii]